ncbi:unnamed protein product, partial [marine sediment metagenome]
DCRLLAGIPEEGYQLVVRTVFWPPRLLVLPYNPQRATTDGTAAQDIAGLLRQHGFLDPVEFRPSQDPVARLCLRIHISELEAPTRDWIIDRISVLARAPYAHELVLRVQFQNITAYYLAKADSFLGELRSRLEREQCSCPALSFVAEGHLLPDGVQDLVKFIDARGASPILVPTADRRLLARPEGPEADAVDALAATGILISLRLTLDDTLPQAELLSRLSIWRAISRGGGLLLVPRVDAQRPAVRGARFAEVLLGLYEADL